ncbi:MAG: hypothetical protein ABI461_22400 [Polyangiaceae bacterium]
MSTLTPEERNTLISSVSSAHRERDAYGEIRAHRAFYDLDETGRVEAHDQTARTRALEAAANADGLTSTARAVLARIRSA